jgi:hypothetical protein
MNDGGFGGNGTFPPTFLGKQRAFRRTLKDKPHGQ